MEKILKVDICVIGAGAGGLTVAAGAAQMGASVALVESGKMGGDCLNYGCIPSKSILAAAKHAQAFRVSESFGIQTMEPQVDFAKVMGHVHKVIKIINETKDSIERFTQLGVKVIQEQGTFIDPKTLKAGNMLISARRFVIATGSSPAVPSIPGLDQVKFYTNETIFDITKRLEHLIIIGGGPIGCELGQAFRMLGSKVTILEGRTILAHDEPEFVGLLRSHLLAQGLTIYENVNIKQVSQKNNQVEVIIKINDHEQNLTGSSLLVATGRRANVNDLNLEAASVRYTPRGIEVNSHLQTSNKCIYAIGDVTGSYQFTHVANYHAGIVLRNILFRLSAKVSYRALPWVTYTEPELAHVGLSIADAKKLDAQAKVLTYDYAEVDRALAENQMFGKIQVVTTKRGKILGVTLLGAQAGELLTPWISAIQQRKSIRCMTDFIIPYPTLSEINKFVANEYYRPLLFSNWTKRIVRFLNLFG